MKWTTATKIVLPDEPNERKADSMIQMRRGSFHRTNGLAKDNEAMFHAQLGVGETHHKIANAEKQEGDAY